MKNNWQSVRLGNVVSIRTGHKDANAQNVNGKYPFFTCAQNILGIDSYTFDCEAVLVAGNGDFNVKYYKGKFDAYQRTYVIEGKDLIKNKFLYYLLQNYLAEVTSNARGSTIQYLKINDFIDFKLNLPNKSVQDKVISLLDTLSETIQKTDQIIQKTEVLKHGVMRDLFTKGIGHKKFKKTKIGNIPDSWMVVKFADMASVERGRFSARPRNDPQFYGGDIPFIQTGDVVKSNGKIKSYSQTLNKEGLKVSKLFKKGTIVLTIAANIGDTGVLDFDSCFPDSLVGITPSKQLNNIYLEYFLRSRKSYLNSIATQSAQKNINLEKLNPMLIAVPSIDEQKKIAEILSSFDEKILADKKIKEKLIILKKGLMQDIFSQKIKI